jgi:hypothetical protein
MANFSDTDKRLASGENRKRPARPPQSAKAADCLKGIPESELDKVTGGVMDDPCAGGQYRRR